MSPWLIGVFTGAILHVYKDKKLTIHPVNITIIFLLTFHKFIKILANKPRHLVDSHSWNDSLRLLRK